MTEKELKRLNRYQLLELLIMQTERADDLQKQLDQAKEALESKNIHLAEMGSVAEAALHLSGVFDAAQSAADLYINAAKERAESIENEARLQAEQILEEARQKAGEILAAGEKQEPAEA